MEQTVDGIVYSEDFKNVLRAESKDITTARLKDGVVSIETSAFLNCKQLSEIYLPSTLKAVKRCAFKNCDSLLKVELGDDFEELPSKWFNFLPEQYKIICKEDSATFKLIKRSSILKAHVESLQLDSAKSEKKKQVQKAGVGAILTAALAQANGTCTLVSSKKDATIVLVSIGKNSGVFRFGTDSTKWIPKIPKIIEILSDQTKSGQDIYDALVQNKLTLAEVNTHTEIPADSAGNLNLFSRGVYKYCYTVNAKHIELYGITKIGLDAFKYNKVESIKLPDGLKSIEDFAFKNCNNIKDISIPEGVTQIGNYAFSNCHSLCSIKLPSTLESLGYYSFCDCVALSSINLPKTIKTIGYYAFSNTNIQNIDETFFGQMNGYDSKFEGMLTIKGGLALSGSKVLYSTKHASSLEIPEGIEELSFNAFHYNHALKSVRLPKSLKVIGRQAFCGCENLSEICFDGSEKDWDKVKKEQWWCAEVAATSVKCKTLFGTKEVELKL